jgi:hypothetical protein
MTVSVELVGGTKQRALVLPMRKFKKKVPVVQL